MLLGVFDEISFTTYFLQKMLDLKVNKNDFNLSKKYIEEHISKKI